MNATPRKDYVKAYPSQYGTLYVTGTMISHTQRADMWVNHDQETFTESCHVTGFNDLSPRVTTYDRESPHFRQYDPRCSCCFLNFTHSTNKHDAATKN